MLIGTFTERPSQDPKLLAKPFGDLMLSNSEFDPVIGSELYHRYLSEKVLAEEVGFDAVMLNEHHSTPFCMGNVMNIEAAILARISQRAKIVLIGNVLPIHEDPLFLAEQLAMIDVISKGRLVTGWVRGNGRESITHNVPTPYNWDRYQEAHDFIKAAWTKPGPFRWEGDFFQYRYVNPWPRPYQQPHPKMFIPGALSRNTVKWAAERGYPYIQLATDLEPTKSSFEYYRQVARETGYEAGPQHLGYMFKVHVEATEELAEATARKYLRGVSNIFIEGNEGVVDDTTSANRKSAKVAPWNRPALPVVLRNLPGMTQTNNLLPTAQTYRGRDGGQLRGAAQLAAARNSAPAAGAGSFEDQVRRYSINYGTPKTIMPRIRHILETLRPGTAVIWDGEGTMTHEDTERSFRLLGQEVLPQMREIAKELGLTGPFETDTTAGVPEREDLSRLAIPIART